MSDEVTVVIPTHQRRELVLDTIASVRAQTGVQARIVVVDDGGTDGTAAALRALDDDLITVLRHETSRGVNAAHNTGLAAVTTPWVAFCDDDDLWAPDKLRAQLDAVAAEGVRWACTGAVHVDAAGRVLRRVYPPPTGDVSGLLAQANVIPGGGSGVLAATDLVREVGGFDERFATLCDWELWLRLAVRSAVASVPRALVGYLVHPDSQIHQPSVIAAELVVLADKSAVHPGMPRVEVGPMWSAKLAIMALRLRQWPVFARMVARSLRSPASARMVAAECAASLGRRVWARPPAPTSAPRDDEAWLMRPGPRGGRVPTGSEPASA